MTEFLHMLQDTQGLLTSVGLIGLALIVFAETGILLGFFLPGDSLLFAAGMLANGDKPLAPPMGSVPHRRHRRVRRQRSRLLCGKESRTGRHE